MGELERDAKRTFYQLAEGSRSGIAWFYVMLGIGAVFVGLGALGHRVAHMPGRDWEIVGAAVLGLSAGVGIIVWAVRKPPAGGR